MTEQQRERVPVLKVRGLCVYYETPKGDVLAVDDINFDLYEGETLGLVGESGCGKSTAAMGVLQAHWNNDVEDLFRLLINDDSADIRRLAVEGLGQRGKAGSQPVQEALARAMQGRTALVIAHRLATIRDADRILVLEAGQIAEEGSHEALLTRNGAYARLANLQFTA